jgi:chitinase
VSTVKPSFHKSNQISSWEYPGLQGAGFNVVSKHDAANFLSFLEELRKDPVGSSLVLSACTSVVPFAGKDGKPRGDISGFSVVLNFINLMNYDVWGPWSNSVGPNAPLDDACAAPEYQIASAISAVRLWTNAGMPRKQIVLAVAGYGREYRVRRSDAFMGGLPFLASYPPFVKTREDPRPCSEDRIDECALAPLVQGILDFKSIIQEGYLNKNGTPRLEIAYRYDDCSQTVSNGLRTLSLYWGCSRSRVS